MCSRTWGKEVTFCCHPGEEASFIALHVRELPGVCGEELGLTFPANTDTNQIAGSTVSSQENKALKTR